MGQKVSLCSSKTKGSKLYFDTDTESNYFQENQVTLQKKLSK